MCYGHECLRAPGAVPHMQGKNRGSSHHQLGLHAFKNCEEKTQNMQGWATQITWTQYTNSHILKWKFGLTEVQPFMMRSQGGAHTT